MTGRSALGFPAANCWTRTVVRPGGTRPRNGMSLNPATGTSPGHAHPRLGSASAAPGANRSLAQAMAVNGTGPSGSSWAHRRPSASPSREESTIAAQGASRFRSAAAPRNAFARFILWPDRPIREESVAPVAGTVNFARPKRDAPPADRARALNRTSEMFGCARLRPDPESCDNCKGIRDE